MSDGDKALKHRITLRVSDKIKAWLDAVGSEHLRGVLEAAIDGQSAPELSTNVEEVAQSAEPVSDKPDPKPVVKAVKRAKVSDKSEGKAAPRKSAIPMDLAAQVARIAAEKEARKKAREGLSDVGRLLSQFGK